MRCTCGKKLSEYELSLKHPLLGHYMDTCQECIGAIVDDMDDDIPESEQDETDNEEENEFEFDDLIKDIENNT